VDTIARADIRGGAPCQQDEPQARLNFYSDLVISMLDWESSSLAVPDLSALHFGDGGQEVIEEEHDDHAGDVQQEATNSSKNCEKFFPEDFLVSPQEDQIKQGQEEAAAQVFNSWPGECLDSASTDVHSRIC